MGKNKFEIEEIVGEKVEDGKKYYYLKWKGYPASANTWEPQDIIASDCPSMVEKFEQRRKKNNDSAPGASQKHSSSAAQLPVAQSSSSTSKNTQKLQSKVRGPVNSKAGGSKSQQEAAAKPHPGQLAASKINGVMPKVYGRRAKVQNAIPQGAPMNQHSGQMASRNKTVTKPCVGLTAGQESGFQEASSKPHLGQTTSRYMKSKDKDTTTKTSVTPSGGRKISQEVAQDPCPVQPGSSEKINTRLPLRTGGKSKVTTTESASAAVQNSSPRIEDSTAKGKRTAKGRARARRTGANKRSQALSAKRRKVEKENDEEKIEIIGAAPDDNGDMTKLQFLFKYSLTDETKFVSREQAIAEHPQLVISFYESKFKWK